jgi:hypothetical protein
MTLRVYVICDRGSETSTGVHIESADYTASEAWDAWREENPESNEAEHECRQMVLTDEDTWRRS